MKLCSLLAFFPQNLSRFAEKCFLTHSFTVQVELNKLSTFYYSVFRSNVPNSRKLSKNPCKIRRILVKPVAIRGEMFSNSLIPSPSRTQRALEIPLLCFSTKDSQLSKTVTKPLKNPSKFCKTRRDSPTKCFGTFSLISDVELDELYLIGTFSDQFNSSAGQKLRNYGLK